MSLIPPLVHSPGISGLISKVMGLVSISLTSFPGGSVVKYLPANAGDTGSLTELGRSSGGGNYTQENIHMHTHTHTHSFFLETHTCTHTHYSLLEAEVISSSESARN